MRKLNRREFIEAIAGIGAAFVAGGCSATGDAKTPSTAPRKTKSLAPTIAVASGNGPAQNTRAAVDALGGMAKLVKKGDFVVIKPNIAWNRPPDAAATTNPEVVAELVRMCKQAGAGEILVIDHLIDRPAEGVLGLTGIRAAAEKAGATVRAAENESDFRSVSIPKGKILKSDTCIKDILKADVFINVPIAKVHTSTQLTLGLKNLMGCIWDRQAWHASSSLDQCIADYATAVRPDLTVLDATRILLTHGPKGPGDTRDVKKVIAGVDPVAVDAFGATLFNLKPTDVAHIRLAGALGVGQSSLKKIKSV